MPDASLYALAFRLFVKDGKRHRELGRFLAGYPHRWVEAGAPEHNRAEARRLGHVAARLWAKAHA